MSVRHAPVAASVFARGAILDLSTVEKATPLDFPQNGQSLYVTFTKEETIATSAYAPRTPWPVARPVERRRTPNTCLCHVLCNIKST